jgi:Protein of unknown function (DUF3752)
MSASETEQSSISDEIACKESRRGKLRSSTSKRKKRSERSPSESRTKRRKHDKEAAAASSSVSSADSGRHRKANKRRKKERKKEHKHDKKSKKSRKHRRDHHHDDDDDDDGSTRISASHNQDKSLGRNYDLADALCLLLEQHPLLASELPLMLIRLASGASLDLSRMTDASAAHGLARVFECLSVFGVQRQAVDTTNHSAATWIWNNPAGVSSTANRTTNDLVLVRVVRATLDQIGFTEQAVYEYEHPSVPVADAKIQANHATTNDATASRARTVEKATLALLDAFGVDLAAELAGLCQMMVDGEAVALEGLEDERLRRGLQALSTSCGLEPTEMVECDNENYTEPNTKGTTITTGYGLPDDENILTEALSMIDLVQTICASARRNVDAGSQRKRVHGPHKYSANDALNDVTAFSDEDDDDGPLPLGAAEKVRASTLSREQVLAAAARREKELARAKSGGGSSSYTNDEEDEDVQVREEWMMVPGKFDFLASIQSGPALRNRQFASTSSGAGGGNSRAAGPEMIDAATRDEIQAIRNVYEASRGPSLMEQHQQAKREAQQAKNSAASQSSSWQWNRDKDIDAGRRVDTNALNMILGGASSDLQTKFQSGQSG